ncbi:unnamed protein product, partial [Allacma fusca]
MDIEIFPEGGYDSFDSSEETESVSTADCVQDFLDLEAKEAGGDTDRSASCSTSPAESPRSLPSTPGKSMELNGMRIKRKLFLPIPEISLSSDDESTSEIQVSVNEDYYRGCSPVSPLSPDWDNLGKELRHHQERNEFWHRGPRFHPPAPPSFPWSP